MFGRRLLAACACLVFATTAFAEQWEEVFPEKNSTQSKYYFDRDISRAGTGVVKTQYMILEKQNREPIPGGPPNRSFNKTVFSANIDCATNGWVFTGRAYYLDNAVQFSQAMPGGKKTPAPPKGSAPLLIAEKVCALR